MKIRLERDVLAEAVQWAARSLPVRPSVPILAGLLVRADADGVTVLNEVVLNQVLVGFDRGDAYTRAVLSAVQREGTCFMTGTTWQGRAAMRISVCNWSTDEADVDAGVAAIRKIADDLAEAGNP